jgi:hypothetical protein
MPPSDNKDRTREPWWVWHWDKHSKVNVDLPYESIIRWRRGSLLTIYRYRTADGGITWWFYLPFNLAIGFAHG